MKPKSILLVAALAASTLLSSCETVQQAVNKVLSDKTRAELSKVAADVVAFNDKTGLIDPKVITGIKLADKLVLKQDGTVSDAFVLASQQLVDKALMEKKLTGEQVDALYAAGTVPLTTPAPDVPADGPSNAYLTPIKF